jgi:hypothetical protein
MVSSVIIVNVAMSHRILKKSKLFRVCTRADKGGTYGSFGKTNVNTLCAGRACIRSDARYKQRGTGRRDVEKYCRPKGAGTPFHHVGGNQQQDHYQQAKT